MFMCIIKSCIIVLSFGKLVWRKMVNINAIQKYGKKGKKLLYRKVIYILNLFK